jgi:hypothetical protein
MMSLFSNFPGSVVRKRKIGTLRLPSAGRGRGEVSIRISVTAQITPFFSSEAISLAHDA